MKVMDNPYWVQAGQIGLDLTAEDANGETVELNNGFGEERVPGWGKIHNSFYMKEEDARRLRTAALLKFRDLHGSWNHLANTPMPTYAYSDEIFRVSDPDGNAPMERKVFHLKGESSGDYIHRVMDADPSWGGGWEHHMRSWGGGSEHHMRKEGSRRWYLMVNESGLSIKREDRASYAHPLQLVGWFHMDAVDGFMESFHHSVLIANNILGDLRDTESLSSSRIAGSGEMASLILYVFGDQMTERERLITLTACNLTNFTMDPYGRYNGRYMNNRDMQTWLDAIEILAPLADPRVYAGFAGFSVSAGTEFRLHTTQEQQLHRSLIYGLARVLLLKKDGANMERMLDRDQDHASRAFTILNCARRSYITMDLTPGKSMVSSEGYGYTEDMLDQIHVTEQVVLFNQNISGPGYLRWKAVGIADPERMLELAKLGISPEDGAHLDAMPSSWSDAWSN